MLQMTHAMWSGEQGTEAAFRGRHYQATRLLNSPQVLSRPHPPIMIGGGGEQKTLRLVAQYGDAANVFGDPPRLAHKFAVLRAHCERLGRPYEEIERTTLQDVRLSADGAGSTRTPAQLVDSFGELADAGVQHVIISLPDVHDLTRLELLGRDVLPQIQGL
jgi:alkanesulfonate monooxygenase SsuD/methylene tetrahydromethanopterin reductase-like flavin-dependent oxidoreductase (luciferase family)